MIPRLNIQRRGKHLKLGRTGIILIEQCGRSFSLPAKVKVKTQLEMQIPSDKRRLPAQHICQDADHFNHCFRAGSDYQLAGWFTKESQKSNGFPLAAFPAVSYLQLLYLL